MPPKVDELAEINGIKPRRYLKANHYVDAPSMSSSAVYTVRRWGSQYQCTCMAWVTQVGVPADARTCKHLRAVLGDEYEDARLKFKNPDGIGVASKKEKGATSKGKKSASKTSKRKKGEDDDNEDEKPKKKKRASTRRTPRSSDQFREKFTPPY